MEILHTINILGVNIPLVEINLEEKEKRNLLVQKTPTATFPFLETTQGNISQSPIPNPQSPLFKINIKII